MLGATGLLIGLTVSLLLLWHPWSRPSEKIEGLKWSHTELAEHLHRSGLHFTTAFAQANPPGMYFYFGTEPQEGIIPPTLKWWTLDFRKGIPENLALMLGDNVLVVIGKSDQQVKDEMGTLGDFGFAWGRFAFIGKPEYLAPIKKSLY